MRTGFLGRSGSHPPPPSPRDLVRYVAQDRPTKTACPRPPLRDHPFKTAMMHKTALQLRPRLRPRTRTLVPGTCRGDVVRVPCSLLASPRSNVPPPVRPYHAGQTSESVHSDATPGRSVWEPPAARTLPVLPSTYPGPTPTATPWTPCNAHAAMLACYKGRACCGRVQVTRARAC